MRYALLLFFFAYSHAYAAAKGNVKWQLIDDFEGQVLSEKWQLVDPDNQTSPYVSNPQVTEIREDKGDRYLIKKPAHEGVIGNRKALTFRTLPTIVDIGETYTFFTRIRVESFPNNHSFGLSNLASQDIIQKSYDAFEPMLRITDKAESDGTKNDGTLMVSKGFKQYARIIDSEEGRVAKPLEQNSWYDLWYVVNNALYVEGGQRFDVYIRGGEFEKQTKVFTGAEFRMQRELPLQQFFMISNTGSKNKPYGNSGVFYDDLYMAKGVLLSDPKVN
jgi:hypothetical protein